MICSYSLFGGAGPGILVGGSGKPEISQMVRALDEAKREAAAVLGTTCNDLRGPTGSDTVRASDAPVQLKIDFQVLQVHRDAETEDLRHAREQAPSPTCMKVILATNIAESSITFVDVCIVMDFALVKARFPYPFCGLAQCAGHF